MEIEIREATIADAETIVGFNSAIAQETEGKSLDADVVGPGVRTLLGDPGKGRYWIAEAGGEIVGQLMVTYEWSDWRNGNVWWIQSVYVLPESRREGVFSQMYRAIYALAESTPGVRGLRLYVEKDNHRAQATYAALGMDGDTYRVMEAMFPVDSNKE